MSLSKQQLPTFDEAARNSAKAIIYKKVRWLLRVIADEDVDEIEQLLDAIGDRYDMETMPNTKKQFQQRRIADCAGPLLALLDGIDKKEKRRAPKDAYTKVLVYTMGICGPVEPCAYSLSDDIWSVRFRPDAVIKEFLRPGSSSSDEDSLIYTAENASKDQALNSCVLTCLEDLEIALRNRPSASANNNEIPLIEEGDDHEASQSE